MSLEVQMAELRARIEQTLGPEGSVTKTLGEIKDDLKEGRKTMGDHTLRVDRLEQTEKTRSKALWAMGTAWLGLLATWFWEHLTRK